MACSSDFTACPLGLRFTRMPFRSFSRPHLREHLGPGFPGAVAVPLRATVSAWRFPSADEPKVARHVFLVRENRSRADVFRHQTVPGASSAKLLENAELPFQSVAPFRAARPWRWLGLAKAFFNSGLAWIKPIFEGLPVRRATT